MTNSKQFGALEILLKDREFLHDLATPLTVALGMNEIVISSLDRGDTDKAIEKARKAELAIKKVIQMVVERRESIIVLQEKMEQL